MKAVLSALLFAGFFGAANANAGVELSGCVMKDMFVKTQNILIIKKGSGMATITCNGDGPGAAMTRQVSIDIAGVGLGLGEFHFYGRDVQLGINDPYEIEGKYMVVNADAALVLGAGANIGLRAFEKGGLAFKIGVAAGQGAGAGLALSTWTFSIVEE